MKQPTNFTLADIEFARMDGISQGSWEQALKTFKAMIKNGETADKIQEYTGFTAAQIQNLLTKPEEEI